MGKMELLLFGIAAAVAFLSRRTIVNTLTPNKLYSDSENIQYTDAPIFAPRDTSAILPDVDFTPILDIPFYEPQNNGGNGGKNSGGKGGGFAAIGNGIIGGLQATAGMIASGLGLASDDGSTSAFNSGVQAGLATRNAAAAVANPAGTVMNAMRNDFGRGDSGGGLSGDTGTSSSPDGRAGDGNRGGGNSGGNGGGGGSSNGGGNSGGTSGRR